MEPHALYFDIPATERPEVLASLMMLSDKSGIHVGQSFLRGNQKLCLSGAIPRTAKVLFEILIHIDAIACAVR